MLKLHLFDPVTGKFNNTPNNTAVCRRLHAAIQGAFEDLVNEGFQPAEVCLLVQEEATLIRCDYGIRAYLKQKLEKDHENSVVGD